MKKVLLLLVSFSIAAISYAITFSTAPKNDNFVINGHTMMIPIGNTGKTISLVDLSTIHLKDFEKAAGRKLKFGEKMKFRMMQKYLNNNLKEDGTMSVKMSDKQMMKAQKAGEKSRKYLRLWLLLLGASIVLYLLGIVLHPLFYIAYLASLASLVYFVLWIIAMSAGE
ncbi:MAG: hypothetical protein ACXWB9_10700 [Flavisolibacter sp.]